VTLILNVLTQAAQTHLLLVGGSLVWRIKYFIFQLGVSCGKCRSCGKHF